MKRFLKSALDLNTKRIIELSERTKTIKPEALKIMIGCRKDHQYYLDMNSKIDKTISYYKLKYQENLSEEERTIIGLYFIISDDDKLINECIKYNMNFKKVAQMYNVSENLLCLRLKVLSKIKKYNQIKTLIYNKKNNIEKKDN